MTSRSFFYLKYLLTINFTVSVIVLIAGCLLSLSERSSIFEFNYALYGVLDNNLITMMIYLAMTETVILGYCFYSKNFQVLIGAGFFLILMMGSMEFYGRVNTIEIDMNFYPFFLYTGLSHILFGAIAAIERKNLKRAPCQNNIITLS